MRKSMLPSRLLMTSEKLLPAKLLSRPLFESLSTEGSRELRKTSMARPPSHWQAV